jgi:hypothetical protein
MDTKNLRTDAERRNEDPITGAPGAHPVGTGLGAIAGGVAAGAATGTVAGPIGTAVGAAVGAIVGGLAGKGVAEMIDPTVEEAYWRDNYANRPYVTKGASYNDYGPAYRYGVDQYSRFHGASFDTVDSDLARDWDNARSDSSLSWDQARHAARDSWDRVDSAMKRTRNA